MNTQEKSGTDKKKERNKRYYRKHKTKILALSKIDYEKRKVSLSEEQKEKHRERSKNYYARTKDDPDRKAVRQACTKSWYQDNKDRILQDKKEWRQQMLGTFEYRFKRAIQTAKRREISFLLTFDQFVEVASHPCYYCDGKFCDPVLEGGGLDRIDSNKGYEISNVVSCGWRCNSIKMEDLTVEETKAAIDAILNVRTINDEI